MRVLVDPLLPIVRTLKVIVMRTASFRTCLFVITSGAYELEFRELKKNPVPELASPLPSKHTMWDVQRISSSDSSNWVLLDWVIIDPPPRHTVG